MAWVEKVLDDHSQLSTKNSEAEKGRQLQVQKEVAEQVLSKGLIAGGSGMLLYGL